MIRNAVTITVGSLRTVFSRIVHGWNVGQHRKGVLHAVANFLDLVQCRLQFLHANLNIIDELLDDVAIEELQEQLPSHQPRYIIYSYKMVHDDSRISYPMCFIFYTPRDSQMELCMLYAKTRMALQREADLTRYYEIRELDDMTEDWLREKLR
uniref:ADF-H domain-containing protein n=1 Tax=Anopheles culicifacies TaxID=139723 RepID=A0A182MAE9_9DIPT